MRVNFLSKKPFKAREAAYLGLLSSLRGECFITDFLKQWKTFHSPSQEDFHLAQEISYGSMQMTLALDYLACQLTDKKKLSLKLSEKALLRTAIYQHHYMNRIPLYAIADESVALAKHYCHQTFAQFLNAILRKLQTTSLTLPTGNDPAELSIRYSYPLFFVNHVIQSNGLEAALRILKAGNQPSPTMFRLRPLADQERPHLSNIQWSCKEPFPVGVIENSSLLSSFSSSPDYYIQNATPATLIGKLCQNLSFIPTKILDVCAAPGGKTIAVYDSFPKAKFYVNDVSEEKTALLKQNLDKYHIPALISCCPGQTLQFPESFDVVILDVPCSNSGVLNKRPEARWRLGQKELSQIEETQLQLLKNAVHLIHKNGEIWYLTCSILKQENEELIQKACQLFSLKIAREPETIFPNLEGWDGGFAVSLKLV